MFPKLPNCRMVINCQRYSSKKYILSSSPFLIKYANAQKSSSSHKSENGFGKWLMLGIPIAGFFLGTWQVKRKKWKLDLIAALEEKTNSSPIPFPTDLKELAHLEYHPLTVSGVFDHSKELFIQPRHLVEKNAKNRPDAGSLMSFKNDKIGVQVITPFFIPDLGIAILVNRGFVPRDKKNPKTRLKGQIEGIIEFTGILRHNEKRPPLVPKNRPKSGQWNYKDLNEMSELLGTSPILLDAVETIGDGPIGGQTRMTLRDEHVQYAITWYGLAIITSVMWYYRFIK